MKVGTERQTRRVLFRHLLWACSLGFVALVLGLGTWGFVDLGARWFDAFYRAVQLFGLNFDRPEATLHKDIPLQLQVARLLAPAVLIAAVIKLMADGVGLRLQRHLNTRVINFPRDVIIGFGPFGQEIGRRLITRGRNVTWIDQVPGGDADLREARETAERLGGFLIAGDPSDPRRLRDARIDRARRVFVALPGDLACFDAAEAVRCILPAWKPLRVFTENPVVSNTLPASAASGFATGRGFDVFNLRAEAVRRLVLTARWDNLALLLEQERVHLVIAGCGWQGEALMEETLLLCNRADLLPPLVTVLDLDAEAVRARLLRRCPALISGEIGVKGFLPPRFHTADLETTDIAALDLWEDESQPKVPVTAWAICTSDDDLNLRAGLHLHTAIQTRRLDGAPVHIRVCSGHAISSHTIGTDGITMSRVFGSLKDGIDQTAALECDPDEVSKRLNRAYMDAQRVSPGLTSDGQQGKVSEEEAEADWANLSASKRNSNRRAHRHAPMKMADLGFDWRGGAVGVLPRLSQGDREQFQVAHRTLYERRFLSAPPNDREASLLFKAMRNEHDRWAIDRALDGWSPSSVRDESRLLHDNMVPWENLGPANDPDAALKIRAYDAVMMRALIDDDSTARNRSAFRANPVLIDIPNDGSVRASRPISEWTDATEFRLRLPPGDTTRPEKTKIEDRSRFLGVMKTAVHREALSYLTLLFPAPPVPPVLKLANDIAALGGTQVAVRSVWLWRAGEDHGARLAEKFENLSFHLEQV